MTAAASRSFQVSVMGTEPILRVEVIKNERAIYTQSPPAGAADPRRLAFSFQDSAFGDVAKSYYHVRVLQSFSREKPDMKGEMAWFSPIFVRRK